MTPPSGHITRHAVMGVMKPVVRAARLVIVALLAP
jgi:hypothetical protein